MANPVIEIIHSDEKDVGLGRICSEGRNEDKE
jgi:hypothetical protein